MVAVMNLPEKLTEQEGERFVILNGISWETYERLLNEHPDSAGPRFTYDQGRLQIMVLSLLHERVNRTLAALVELVTEEFEIDLIRTGSTTFKRQDLLKGFEPDTCFYLQNAEAISGKDKIDLLSDPPPDLVIEIDISSGSLNKFPIFAAVGVPEVWRFDGETVAIFVLENGEYGKAEHSLALAPLDSEILTKFLADSVEMKSNAWKRSVREWARAQSKPEDQQ